MSETTTLNPTSDQTANHPIDINLTDFENLKNTTELVLIDFWAEWCGPCKVMGPIIDRLSPTYFNVKFLKVNVDEAPELSELFSIQSIPTFYMVKFSGDGSFDVKANIVGKIIGAVSEFDFKLAVDKIVEKVSQ